MRKHSDNYNIGKKSCHEKEIAYISNFYDENGMEVFAIARNRNGRICLEWEYRIGCKDMEAVIVAVVEE